MPWRQLPGTDFGPERGDGSIGSDHRQQQRRKEIPCGTGEDDPLAGFYCSHDCKQNHEPRLDSIFSYAVGRYGEEVAKALIEAENDA